MPSLYARKFDERNPNWCPKLDYNLIFLRTQQAWFNDKLKAQGHLFLNEVYDALGFPRRKAGAVVGWWNQEGAYVDLGLFTDETNLEKALSANNFIVDPNVEGIIYDRLPE